MSRGPAGNGHTRAMLAHRDGWRCCWCGVGLQRDGTGDLAPTVEHVVPRSRGGTNDLENLKLACWWCNQHRGDASGPPPMRSEPPPTRVHLRLTTRPPGARRNPLADACVVCGAVSPDGMYCAAHQ